MTNTINVNLTEETINIEVGTDVITIEVGAISNLQPWAESDVLFPLDGEGGTTGFKHNSTTNRIEFYIDGELVKEIAEEENEGDPFA